MSKRRINAAELAAMTAAEAASFWVVHRDQDAALPDDDIAFRSWLGASIQNRTAYDRAEGIWQDFEAIVDPAELTALRSAALASTSRPRRWRQLAAALFAACLAALAASVWFTDRFSVSIGMRPLDIAAVR
jgi:ferric-dicitrate binding protein FerR (iron transport regulator)